MKGFHKYVDRVLIGFVLSAVVGISGAAAAILQIFPAAPRYLEPVYLRYTQEICVLFPIGASVAMDGNVITVDVHYYPDLGTCSIDIELGRFPAGNYTVKGFPSDLHFTVAPSLIGFDLVAIRGTVPAVNYSGHWWTPSESGWGISIEQGPTNVLYAVWFVYGPNGIPVWYAFQGSQWLAGGKVNSISGSIFKTNGPYFGGPFDPNQVGITQVGSGSLRFDAFNTGQFFYTVENVSGAKAITRLIIE
jgi:hypothetical protein